MNKVAVQSPTYDQDDWVRIQRYNEMSWSFLVTLWSAYDSHLSHIIECIPEDAGSSTSNIGKEEPVILEFVVKDDFRHLQHHLKDILEEQA